MSRYEQLIPAEVTRYVLAHSLREPAILARLREETASHPRANFQIPPEQGQLLQLLLRMSGARRVIEAGVFTGYSSLAMALALPEGGRIHAFDISDEYTSVARRYWAEAGVADRVELTIGPAADSLARLIAEGQTGFDFAFIDADKPCYHVYYEQCLQLVRQGGLIALDNMLLRGLVLDESPVDENAAALRQLNDFIHQDERVDALLLPFGDGLTLAVKR